MTTGKNADFIGLALKNCYLVGGGLFLGKMSKYLAGGGTPPSIRPVGKTLRQ